MSDEGFLKRWSRRKRTPEPEVERAPAETPRAEEGLAKAGQEPPEVAPQERMPSPARNEDAIDPATLPPLESLGPDSDYTVFLRKGVPEAIRIAALRKAWMSDPFIRDFRGPAEYALDYTTPEFDLRPTDDVAKMLDRLFPPKAPESDAAAEPPAQPEALPAPPPDAAVQPVAESNLPQKQAEEPLPQPAADAPAASTAPSEGRRKHGGALPD